MNKKVFGLSLVLVLGASLQATAGLNDMYFWAKNIFHRTPTQVVAAPVIVAPVIPAPTGKIAWLKNGVQKIGQTRVAQIATAKAVKMVQTAKAHPIITGVAATAVLGTALLYLLTSPKKTTARRVRA
jgi:hypothetical protein